MHKHLACNKRRLIQSFSADFIIFNFFKTLRRMKLLFIAVAVLVLVASEAARRDPLAELERLPGEKNDM